METEEAVGSTEEGNDLMVSAMLRRRMTKELGLPEDYFEDKPASKTRGKSLHLVTVVGTPPGSRWWLRQRPK